MFSEYFIDRPRFAGVISVIMILLGLLAIAVLPVSQYPQITPPQIVVSTTYPGASAQVLVDTVAVPIENQINGVENMLYMSSSSDDNGSYSLTITFDVGTDPDIAQVKVQNRLSQVMSQLPALVQQEGIDSRPRCPTFWACWCCVRRTTPIMTFTSATSPIPTFKIRWPVLTASVTFPSTDRSTVCAFGSTATGFLRSA